MNAPNIFPGQLFQPRDYDAFSGNKPWMDTQQERDERLRVIDKMLWLHERLLPRIEGHRWDLHPHHQRQHLTSSFHHVWLNVSTKECDDHEPAEGYWKPVVDEISAIWLHYGKSKPQLEVYKSFPGIVADVSQYYNAFYIQARIQVFINVDSVRLWLLFTDKNYYDRHMFHKNLRRDSQFRNKYWGHIQNLMDKRFFYEIEGERLPLVTGLSEGEFFDFLKKDRSGVYSGIVREYDPLDPRISKARIVDEMWDGFRLLYPLYDMMAYRQPPSGQGVNMPPNPYAGLFNGNVRIKK